MTLILKHANKNRLDAIDLGPKRFRCMRRRPLHRTHIIAAGTGRAPVVLDNHRHGLSADDPQSRLFSDTRASDGRFQSAVARLKVVTFPQLSRLGAFFMSTEHNERLWLWHH